MGWRFSIAANARGSFLVAGQIVLASGPVKSGDYTGPAEVRIDSTYLSGRSCITVQTQPSAVDLAEKRAFQEAVIRLLTQAGMLGAGSYRLVAARRHAVAGTHLFAGLTRNNCDFLETFCLSHGAVALPESPAVSRKSAQPRFCYHHQLVVAANNERAARVQAASALPDNELWAEVELKHFKLESIDHGRYTFVVELAFSAADETHARAMVVDLFDQLVKPDRVVVTRAPGPNNAPQPARNGRSRRR
jgi:hypothetical protein